MSPEKKHISICICTFKRPRLLSGLLRDLESQATEDFFDYSIVVVDNDMTASARAAVETEAHRLRIEIGYFVEPEQNIAKARNKAVANSRGDFVAFIDDDELPDSRWLLKMFQALNFFETDGVLGPVLPRFLSSPPPWVKRGKFFERPAHYSGYFLFPEFTRTGNCLLRRSIFKNNEDWFRPQFGSGGEDRDFFGRLIARGCVFVWCNEAPVYEAIHSERWNKWNLLKRALLRGKMTYFSRKTNLKDILRSCFAIIFYSMGLPLLLLLSPAIGFDIFMKYLISDFDHIGKINALFNINLLKTRYVMSPDEPGP